MVFHPPSWMPELPVPSRTMSLPQFMYEDYHGRKLKHASRPPFTCGATGRSYSAVEVAQRVDYLSRSLAAAVGFDTEEGTEWERVVGIFSYNSIDYVPATHAVHRISGIATPANAAYTAQELQYHLKASRARALFVCVSLLETALKATRPLGIPDENIFILPLPDQPHDPRFKSIDDLIAQGKALPPLPPQEWIDGRSARQVAYLSFSSGTSGTPKAVKLSHYNIISNVVQTTVFEGVSRQKAGVDTQVALGVLPFSHIYGLSVISHCGMYRGDEIIVLHRFDLKKTLEIIQKHKINHLYIVPPILIQLIRNKDLCAQYDLSSVRFVMSGAAPLGGETVSQILDMFPWWKLGQGYGLTESSPSAVAQAEFDPMPGGAGSLIVGTRAKIIDSNGKEVTGYEERGEMYLQSPSIALGYLDNDKSSAETFVWDKDGRWLRTGDEVIVRKSPLGSEQFVVVDRLKELIKVKGHQVAPAELEAHLLDHSLVSDCAVIGIPSVESGEVPRAFVVLSPQAKGISQEDVTKTLLKHVEDHKTRHKWLKGGIEFIQTVPKSPSGKILRRLLRDQYAKASKPGPRL